MRHPRQAARLTDHLVRVRGLRRVGDELQGDFAIELRVPRAVDEPARTTADDTAQREVSPLAVDGLQQRLWWREVRIGRIGLRVAVQLCDAGHDAQLFDERSRL